MRILKEGNLENTKRPAIFTCWNCGCKWEANNDEYILQQGQLKPYPVCNCPCCDKSSAGIVMVPTNEFLE